MSSTNLAVKDALKEDISIVFAKGNKIVSFCHFLLHKLLQNKQEQLE